LQNHFANNSNSVVDGGGGQQKNFRPDSALSPHNGNAVVTDKATSSSLIDTSIFASSATTADLLNTALENDLIDLTTCNAGTAAAKADDLFTADIDFMNNYLKSLPDYSNLQNKPVQQQQQQVIKLRENPTPKPFHNIFANSSDALNNNNSVHVPPSSPLLLHKHGVSQSPQLQRRPSASLSAAGKNPLSKSSSLHTFTKQQQQRNYFGNVPMHQLPPSQQQQHQNYYKETCVDEISQNKISRSTSSNSMMNDPMSAGGGGSLSGGHGAKEGSDFMGFMRKPSSLMNIFKKLGSQSSSSFSPQQNQQQTHASHDANANEHKKAPSSENKKSISDFWKENVVSSSNQPSQKFGWNYHKIIPQFNQQKPAMQQQTTQMHPKPVIPSPSAKHKIISNNNVKKMEPAATASKPIFIKSRDSPKKEIVQQESPKQPSAAVVVDSHLNKSICDQEFHKHKSLAMNDKNNAVNNNASNIQNASGKLRESMRQAKEDFLLNGSKAKINEPDNAKLLKSSSNSHIYMNQDDPNYFKNLHKITKSLNNATDMMVSKQPLHKSVSNSSVPNYLTSNPTAVPHIHHNHHPPPLHMQPQYHQLYFLPSSAPVHPPAFIYPGFPPPPHEMQIIQPNPKTNIPICYKYQLHKSSSNSSMGPPTIGFYSLADKPAFIPTTSVLWPMTQPHMINKSSSSSCIYAKTLSQPAHLSKNNGMFARYKPILSDDDNDNDSESDDDDISKHSNASYVNNVPAPPPFGNARKHSTSSTISGSGNFTPFTKISSIQIPINGQLPPPFKSKNAATGTPSVGMQQEGNQRSNNAINNKSSEIQSIAINDNAAKTISSATNIAAATPSTAQPYNRANNIFYNIISNPLTATQNISNAAMQMQDGQPSCVGVGGEQQIYTPYTKYLSDRKYFDVSVCENKASLVQQQQGAEQRRNSGATACTNKSKIPMAIPKTSTMTNNAPSQSVNASAVIKSTSNNDILSAFDPFYVDDLQQQQQQRQHKAPHNASNKLHQLLTTVANEQWGESKKKSKKSVDEDGSDLLYKSSVEVDESNLNLLYERFYLSIFA
jgi:hypothetical protein